MKKMESRIVATLGPTGLMTDKFTTETQKQHLHILLNGDGKTAAELTHHLCEFGEGKMSNGTKNLRNNGVCTGLVGGSALMFVLYSTVLGSICFWKHQQKKKKSNKLPVHTVTIPTNNTISIPVSVEQNPDDENVLPIQDNNNQNMNLFEAHTT